MFPYDGLLPTDFNFRGSTVLARSSDENVHHFHASHSSVYDQTAASMSVTLNAEG